VGSRVVVAPRGTAELSLTTGTRLDLDGESDLAVQQNGSIQRFRLATGSVNATVAKLGPGERFIVDTPDASVEVRGTAFRLSVLDRATACDEGTRTRLSVSEGVVTVSSRGNVTQVAAGARWPAECGAAAGSAKVEVERAAASEASAAPARLVKRKPVAPAHGSTEVKASTLSRQNDLFADAARKRRSGDVSSALRLYGEFVRTYPNSPLTQNARVEIMRLTSSQDAKAASRQARRYLNDYPNGFAREEAEKLAGLQ
jgi:ferric-dicitrate binding protein FerR (iron transport regulator)